MRREKSKTKSPKIVGTGLTALDIVIQSETNSSLSAGGTCANVLTALSYLGWHSVLISRLGADYAAQIVLEDLATFGVDVQFATLEPAARTPVIVERLRKDSHGQPFHTFSFNCPSCGRRLPSYQPVTSAQQEDHLPKLTSGTRVCFIDRLSRGAIDLAQEVSTKGGIVFFEPSSIGNEKLFREMMRYASILKYSHERLVDQGDIEWSDSTIMEVQTLGRGGVRFRFREATRRSKWHHCDARPLEKLIDSCGAGDWFSAGLIHWMCFSRARRLKSLNLTSATSAINFAQRLSVWTCGFPGARGGMYIESGRADLRSLVRLKRPQTAKATPEDDRMIGTICGCEVPASKLHEAMHEASNLGKIETNR